MARDGTYRGGRRVRAGDKPDTLADKIASGNSAQILDFPDFDLNGVPEGEIPEFNDIPDMQGENIPKPGVYLKSRQKDGKPLGADKIYEETWKWLKARRCEKFINRRLLESYSQAFARYVQCEEAISEFGFLAKHPKTEAAIANPFVQMSLAFQKQANLLWYEIFDIVKQNCTINYIGTPQDDVMEQLLSKRS